MSGNREAFQNLMTAGDDAAWDKNWPEAINYYSKAIHEFPEDPEAHSRLGFCLLESGRLDDALKIYTRAYELAPDDPVPLAKSAEALEKLGRLKEAAQQYVHVADLYFQQRDLRRAIANWEQATHLTPALVSIHAKLAQAYERIGDKKTAVNEYLTVAYYVYHADEIDNAEKTIERALRLDRRNSQALNMLRAVRSRGEVTLPDHDEDRAPVEDQPVIVWDDHDSRQDIGEAHPLGPMGEALDNALEILAEYMFSSGDLTAASGDAMQAMELQRQELFDQAIAAYERAEGSLRHPALKMSLGGLLFLTDAPDKAVKHLGEAVMDQYLSAGAYHALGQSYFKIGKQKQAARYLIQSLQAVDTSLAAHDEEIAQLTEIYERLLGALDGRTDDALEAVNGRFIDLLTGKDWKQRISETRRHLEEVMRDEGDQGVVDFLGTGGSDRLASTVARIDTYIRQGVLTLAMDEAHSAVESSPYYLPVHVRQAEILMREGRLRQAIEKYNTVARAYMSRDENDRAAGILSEVLEMAPLDVSVRTSLISLLESEDRMDEALDQYIDLAGTYNQLGNFDLARETYQKSERLGRRVEASAEKMAAIKHNLADMAQMRLDTRQAVKMYEEIVELSPNDERAYRMLVDLNYNQGNTVEAIKHLDKLLGLYAKRKQISKIVQLLEDLVKRSPDDMGLRSRLAAIFEQMDRRDEAIEQLDALGEQQLDAGLRDEACNTLQRIVLLKPDNIADYEELLRQLGC